MPTPDAILENALERATITIDRLIVTDEEILERIIFVTRCLTNRAGVHLLMTCALEPVRKLATRVFYRVVSRVILRVSTGGASIQ
ncbi:MAG: hypothetical protein KA338_24070, partial [Chloroflexi bacterium]|nr:hypothetical protein [Chloroflexota bacterium]